MKKLFLAAIIAVTALSAISLPAMAASVTITTDRHQPDARRHHEDRRHGRHSLHERHHRQHCYVKRTKVWRNHHLVIRKVRVCD